VLSFHQLHAPLDGVSYLRCGPVTVLMGRGNWSGEQFDAMVTSLGLAGTEHQWSKYLLDEATDTECWFVQTHNVPAIPKQVIAE